MKQKIIFLLALFLLLAPVSSSLAAFKEQSLATDGNLSTYERMGDGQVLIFTLDEKEPVALSQFRITFYRLSNPSGARVEFLDGNGNTLYAYNFNVPSGSRNTQGYTSNITNKARVSSIKVTSTATVTELAEVAYTVAPPEAIIYDDVSNFQITKNNMDVSLSWIIPTNNPNFTGSKIYRDNVLIETVDKTISQYKDSNLKPGDYVYKVTA
uniref:hypothetical protein n=1 Tax=Cytobacillus sp. Bac17 TaxID=2926008 RepID=UPI002117708A